MSGKRKLETTISAVHEEKKPQICSTINLYFCAICEDQFSEIEELTEHINAVHEKSMNMYKY